jgi:hypothetical protein
VGAENNLKSPNLTGPILYGIIPFHKIGKSHGMKKTPVFTAILFLGISLLAFIESSGMKKHLSLADQFTPLSPDKYLKILGAMIAFVTILYLGKEIFFTRHPAVQIRRIKFHDLLTAMGIFIGYVAFIPWLGYILGTFFFYFLFLRFVGRYSFPKTLMIAIIITLCMELIFAKGLQIVVPTGILEF